MTSRNPTGRGGRQRQDNHRTEDVVHELGVSVQDLYGALPPLSANTPCPLRVHELDGRSSRYSSLSSANATGNQALTVNSFFCPLALTVNSSAFHCLQRYTGKTKKLSINRKVNCDDCGGSGSTKPGATSSTCRECDGQGTVLFSR
jgi:hypothetical protein